MKSVPPGLPGADLVRSGIADLRHGRITENALLVSAGAQRIRESGVRVPRALRSPEERLYALLSKKHGNAAHSRYNALIRRLVSFARALECASR